MNLKDIISEISFIILCRKHVSDKESIYLEGMESDSKFGSYLQRRMLSRNLELSHTLNAYG